MSLVTDSKKNVNKEMRLLDIDAEGSIYLGEQIQSIYFLHFEMILILAHLS